MLRRKKVIQTLDDKDESVPPDFAKLLNKNYRLVSALFAWDSFKSYYKACDRHPEWLQDDLGGWLDGLPQDRIQRILDGRCSLKATYEFDIAEEEARVRKLTAQLLQHIRSITLADVMRDSTRKMRVLAKLDRMQGVVPKARVGKHNRLTETWTVWIPRSVYTQRVRGYEFACKIQNKVNNEIKNGMYFMLDGEVQRRTNERTNTRITG